MKEKKGKKSLGDLGNLIVKRSTRLKELARLVPTQKFGTTSTSIQTTSFSDAQPPSYFIIDDSIIFCEKIGRYLYVPCGGPGAYFFDFNKDNDYINLDGTPNPQKGVGWRFNVYPGNWSNVVPDAPSYGYLFVYFHKSFERGDCGGTVSAKKAGGICSQIYNNNPGVRNSHQGEIFAVVISSIAEINALNRTFASQTNGSYLSTTINNAINVKFTQGDLDDFYVRNFINDIRSRNNNDTTPFRPYDPVNPLSLFVDNVFKFYGGEKNKIYNIKERLLIQETFISSILLNNIRKFLPMSHVQKLSFKVLNLLTFDYDDRNKPLSGIAELVNNNTSIKFLDLGFFVITYEIGPCDDYENIYENPKGPSFYGPKVFTMRFEALIR